MSNLWLNLRVLAWHLQIGPDKPWVTFGFNPYWWGKRMFRPPIQLH